MFILQSSSIDWQLSLHEPSFCRVLQVDSAVSINKAERTDFLSNKSNYAAISGSY